MKITFSRGGLRDAVPGLGKVVPTRTNLAVLNYVRFAITGDSLTATATDLDQTLVYSFAEAEYEGEGVVIAPYEQARRLSSDPDKVVASVSAAFPAVDRLDRHFGFNMSLFQIRLPEALDAELVSAGDRQELMRAREQAAQEARRRIGEGVESFVGDCVTSLRQQTATLCEEMLESMRTGKSGVHQRTLNRLTEFIDNFRSLNFANDAELDSRLTEVRQRFLNTTAETYRDDASARMRMTDGIRNLANAARELAQADTKAVVEGFGRMGTRRFTLAA